VLSVVVVALVMLATWPGEPPGPVSQRPKSPRRVGCCSSSGWSAGGTGPEPPGAWYAGAPDSDGGANGLLEVGDSGAGVDSVDGGGGEEGLEGDWPDAGADGAEDGVLGDPGFSACSSTR